MANLESEFPDKVDFGLGRIETFSSIHHLIEFSQSELDFWSFLQYPPSKNVSELVSAVHSRWSNVVESLNLATRQSDTDQSLHLFRDAKKSMCSNFVESGAMLSSEPGSIFLKSLLFTQPFGNESKSDYRIRIEHLLRISFFAISNHQSSRLNPVTFADMLVLFPAMLFVNNLNASAEAQTGAFVQLWKEHQEQRARLSELFVVTKRTSEKRISDNSNELHTSRDEHRAFVEQAKSEWESLKKKFEVHLTLEAPANYWKGKAAKHECLVKRLGIALMMIVATLVIGVGAEIACLLVPQILSGIKEPSEAVSPAHYVPTISLIVVTLSIFVFLLRPILKLYMSNSHLGTVARERVVMIETYQTMFHEQMITNDEDRHIILSALFQHTPSGLIDGRDDAPSTGPEAVLNFVDRAGRS